MIPHNLDDHSMHIQMVCHFLFQSQLLKKRSIYPKSHLMDVAIITISSLPKVAVMQYEKFSSHHWSWFLPSLLMYVPFVPSIVICIVLPRSVVPGRLCRAKRALRCGAHGLPWYRSGTFDPPFPRKTEHIEISILPERM